jgi:RNA polymerase sigma-70 factor (ECF subfamily)
LCEGDVDAWQRLYDAHAERVWRLVSRAMAPGSSDVADVVQETFLAAARSARTYDVSRGSLASWLNGIVRRQVALYYRREKRHSSASGASTLFRGDRCIRSGAVAPGDANPTTALDVAERASLVRAALTKLPTDYEVLLTSKYIDGATVEQIAVAESSTQEAIRSKLARARRAFRRAFRRDFPETT